LTLLACTLVAAAGCIPVLPGVPTNVSATPRTREACLELWTKLDVDKDGTLTEAEYLAGRIQLAGGVVTDASLSAELKAMDGNNDGKISQEEWLKACIGSVPSPDVRPSPSLKPTEPPPNDDCKDKIKIWDRNGDGKVSLDEYLGANPNMADASVSFRQMDKNGDGFLTPDELCGDKPPASPPPKDDCKEQFNGWDRDRDGKLSLDEFLAVYPGDRDRFEKLDRNRDRFLTIDEWCSEVKPTPPPNDDCKDKLKVWDRNGDGKVSLDEYLGANPNMADASVSFRPMDKNGDGFLTPDELCGDKPPASPPPKDDCKEQFATLDRDRDGSVSLEEFLAVYPGDRDRFDKLNRNGDKVLSPEEWCNDVKPTPPPVDCNRSAVIMDVNQDGSISPDEYISYMMQQQNVTNPGQDYKDNLTAELKGKDGNRDGVITYVELCGDKPPTESPKPQTSCEKEFASFDVNGDGFVSYEEYVNGKWGQLRFVKAPTADEEAKTKAGFKADASKLDGNQDGKLSFEEYAKGCVNS
jgi:Ca2+-binding EF-hand superfamily protein